VRNKREPWEFLFRRIHFDMFLSKRLGDTVKGTTVTLSHTRDNLLGANPQRAYSPGPNRDYG
jgi:hypothetical protein